MAMTTQHNALYIDLASAANALDPALSAYVSAQAAVDSANAQLVAAKAALDTAWNAFKAKDAIFAGAMLTPPPGYTPPAS